jgi:succinoglycan biosynthesis transport protein ExoP
VDFSQFLQLLRARRRLFWTIFGSIMAAAIAITAILPKKYVGEVQVIVDSKASDPITGLVMPQLVESANLATQIDVITSHKVATKVVDALHLASTPESQAQFHEDTDGEGSIRDWLADKLLGHLEVKPSRQSNMITIRFLASNPDFASQGANTFADAYIQTGMELTADPARRQSSWFDSQIRVLRSNVETAQRRLSEYQRQENIVASDEHLDVETAKLGELTTQLIGAQTTMYDAQTRLRQMNQALARNQIDELPDILGNPLLQSMKVDLTRLQGTLAETAQRFDRNHPRYISAAAQVAALQAKLASELSTAKGSINQSAEIAERRAAELQRAVDAQKARILGLKRRNDTLDVLKHDVDAAQHAYDVAEQRASEVRLQGQLDQSNIAVLNSAIPPLKAARPRWWLNLLVGFVLGTTVALASVLIAELRNRRVRSREDLARYTDLVVLAELPHIAVAGWTGRFRLRGRNQSLLEAKPA